MYFFSELHSCIELHEDQIFNYKFKILIVWIEMIGITDPDKIKSENQLIASYEDLIKKHEKQIEKCYDELEKLT